MARMILTGAVEFFPAAAGPWDVFESSVECVRLRSGIFFYVVLR